MAYLVGVLIAVVVILASIALHEVGHMVPAKRFGVRVSQYMVGFGPTIWSKTKGETEYGLKWIPLGGYVRLVGMFPTKEAVDAKEPTTWAGRAAADAREMSAEEIRPGEDGRAFYRLSVPKKLVVMFGGPFMNLLLAFVLMAIVLVGIGLPVTTTTVGAVGGCVLAGNEEECAEGAPVGPAAAAGMLPGDTIVSWGGQPISTWDDAWRAIRASSGSVEVLVQRDGRPVTLTVDVAQTERPAVDDDGLLVTDASGDVVMTLVGYAGIEPQRVMERQPLWSVPVAVGDMTVQTASIVVVLPQRVWDVAARTFSGQDRGSETVLSVVGVSRIVGETAAIQDERVTLARQAAMLLSILAALNISLFVFNMIPLPPLDGGHIAAALWEGVRKRVSRWRGVERTRPADSARLVPVGYVMFVLLIVMGVVMIWADIVNPARLF
ncbi:MAG: site-2 protease family protein [Micrococcales bacterium]|nr:site-2 protease family protein [Micrococcales bacterium]